MGPASTAGAAARSSASQSFIAPTIVRSAGKTTGKAEHRGSQEVVKKRLKAVERGTGMGRFMIQACSAH
jgi:hypothetical protein